MVYAADIYGPNAIAADYNEAHSVIELPRQGNKGEVYGKHVCHPDFTMPRGHPVILTLRPHPDFAEVLNLQLQISATGLQLQHSDGSDVPEGTTLASLKGKEAFVTLQFDPTLSLEQVIQYARQVEQIEQLNGFRVDPPPPQHPYYKAFLSDTKYLDRTNRPAQPIEFHVSKKNDTGFVGELILIEEKWGEETEPTLIETKHTITHLAEFDRIVNEGENAENPTLFIYIDPATTTYGDMQQFLSSRMERFPVIFMYSQTP